MNKNLAIVFPGQGSQTVGMVDELANDYPETKTYFEQASDVLGYDLWQLVSAGPEEELNLTEKTQPAMLVAAYACWKAWLGEGGTLPKMVAGHSLGEYTALIAAGAIGFTDAVKLVSLRGKYMTDAVLEQKGSMAAIIGLDDGRIEEICDETSASTGEIVIPANYNSIGQVVIAGNEAAVEKAIEEANAAGARLAKILPVSVPCHCPLMEPASERLSEALKKVEIKAPEIPVLNNVDVELYKSPDAIRDGLVRQLYSPVRWVETILKMREHDISSVIEVGPGNVLVGLTRRIERKLKPVSIHNQATIKSALS